MTIILTLVGLIVFFISIFTKGFKTAFWRLVAFSITGLVLDVLIGSAFALITVCLAQ